MRPTLSAALLFAALAPDDIAASERPTWDDDAERDLAAWIDALRAGTNPFKAKVLAALR